MKEHRGDARAWRKLTSLAWLKSHVRNLNCLGTSCPTRGVSSGIASLDSFDSAPHASASTYSEFIRGKTLGRMVWAAYRIRPGSEPTRPWMELAKIAFMGPSAPFGCVLCTLNGYRGFPSPPQTLSLRYFKPSMMNLAAGELSEEEFFGCDKATNTQSTNERIWNSNNAKRKFFPCPIGPVSIFPSQIKIGNLNERCGSVVEFLSRLQRTRSS